LAAIYEEQPAGKKVRQWLFDAGEGKVTLWVNIINLGEIYYIAGRTRGRQRADEIIRELRQLPIIIDPVGEAVVLQAAAYKMRYPISYADAFALTAAIRLDAALVTGDPELIALGDIVTIEPLQRNR
jgi:ribonuclease VapC